MIFFIGPAFRAEQPGGCGFGLSYAIATAIFAIAVLMSCVILSHPS